MHFVYGLKIDPAPRLTQVSVEAVKGMQQTIGAYSINVIISFAPPTPPVICASMQAGRGGGQTLNSMASSFPSTHPQTSLNGVTHGNGRKRMCVRLPT